VASLDLLGGRILDLILASAITRGATVVVNYAAPAEIAEAPKTNKALQDSAGNDTLSFQIQNLPNYSNVTALALPVAPTIVAGPESVVATVTAPASGEQPFKHRVWASPGNANCDIMSASGSCTISGLTAGISYVFTVVSYDTFLQSTSKGAASPAVTVLAKTAAAVTETVPASYTPSWDKEPLTDSETDSNTVGYMPATSPGTIIITDEFGFTLDKKNGIKPKIRMKNYAGKIKMSISATYKDGAKTKKYKCAFKPFGTIKKLKTAKWRWYSPKKACVLPAPLVTAIRANKATLSTTGKWTRQALKTGKKVRADNSKIKARNLKYKVKAKV
jgi:hypothetical protein